GGGGASLARWPRKGGEGAGRPPPSPPRGGGGARGSAADRSRCKPPPRLRQSSIATHLMLTLRSSPASPFVRKVRIAANVLGLERDIAVEPADTMNPSDSVRRQNPLGKIPALVLEDGTVLF